MKALIFGATGMVGQGLLRECLLDRRVETVLTVGRSVTGQKHAKLQEIAHTELLELSSIEERLAGFDVCFFCLGVSSVGMAEDEYRRITYELTLSVARTLSRLNPGMIFEYVSGASTDSTERGRSMWARVKGRTENELLGLRFKAAYMLRPGVIVPLHGIKSKTALYRVMYAIIRPILPLLRNLFPKYVTTTEELGQVMIELAFQGGKSRVIENKQIAEF